MIAGQEQKAIFRVLQDLLRIHNIERVNIADTTPSSSSFFVLLISLVFLLRNWTSSVLLPSIKIVPCVVSINLAEQHLGISFKVLDLDEIYDRNSFQNVCHVGHRDLLELCPNVFDALKESQRHALMFGHVFLKAVLT